jgi:hypothetical protein
MKRILCWLGFHDDEHDFDWHENPSWKHGDVLGTIIYYRKCRRCSRTHTFKFKTFHHRHFDYAPYDECIAIINDIFAKED